MNQSFVPNKALAQRVTLYRWALNTAVFVIAMIAAYAFQLGILGLLAVLAINWLGKLFYHPLSVAKNGVHLNEQGIELDFGIKLAYRDIRRIEIMPYQSANWLQRTVWRQHPGNYCFKLHTTGNDEHVLDVSLYLQDSRVTLLNSIKDRSFSQMVSPVSTA